MKDFHDLKSWQKARRDYVDLNQRTTEIKRMLATLQQKLRAER